MAGTFDPLSVVRLLLAAATRGQVDAAVDAVEDALLDPGWVRSKMVVRHAGALAGTYPAVLDMLTAGGEPAGWVGWAPYTSSPSLGTVWESTIFFAPRLRGSGLLPYAFCWQAHLADAVPAGAGASAVLISSIASSNTRSINAHRHWAEACGWDTRWEVRSEPVRGRRAVVLHWPDQRPVPHP